MKEPWTIVRLAESEILVVSCPAGDDDHRTLATTLERTPAARMLSGIMDQAAEVRDNARWTYLRVEHDEWGAPRLTHAGRPLPLSVSCTRCGGTLYAALCAATAGILPAVGIDMASPDEFPETYPWEKAFAPGERDRAAMFVPRSADAAALCWAMKEAYVKAMGTGFKRFSPDEVFATVDDYREGVFHARVCAGVCLPARATREPDGFLALCLRS